MNQAGAQYVQRLDLGADPFAPGFDGNYFYGGASRKHILDQMVHLSRFGDHVIIVTGDSGSGTSTLLEATFSQLQPLMDCCQINAELDRSPEAMLASVSDQLRLHLDPPVTATDFLLALQECSGVDDGPEPVLIAVDQAHHLELEGFECLLDIVLRAHGTVRLLLVGESQIKQLAQLAGFVSERIKELDVQPLTLTEIDEYLIGLLRSVGYAGNQPLSSQQLALLHELSGGNIGDINNLVPGLLLDDDNQPRKRFALAIPTTHLAAIIVIVAALLASYFYQSEDQASHDARVKTPTPGAPVDRKSIAVSNEVRIKLLEESERRQQNAPVQPARAAETSVAPVTRVPVRASKTVGNTESSTKSGKTTAINNTPVKTDQAGGTRHASAKTDQASSAGHTRTKMDQAGSTGRVRAKTDQAGSTGHAPAKTDQVGGTGHTPAKVDHATNAGKPASASSAAVSNTKKATSSPVNANATGTTGSFLATISPRARRVMNMPETAYMLQLLGSVEEKRARDFVTRYVGRLPITYIEIRRNDKPWYIVLAGPFDDHAAATRARRQLPATLQQQKPWSRSVLSLQNEIRNTWR